MTSRIVLHIGSMKSGTSFLQTVMVGNRQALAEAGYAFLGGTFGAQSRAVRDLTRLPANPQRHRAGWVDLVREARAFDGAAGVISMEFLSFVRDEVMVEVLAPLRGLEVQIVLTVRDQFGAIPAQWQTFTRNLGTDDWPGYLQEIRGDAAGSSRAHRTFHRAQGIGRILDRWSGATEVHRVEVVTVPPPGAPREELWHRFCAATGMPPESADLDKSRSNQSLGYGSCDFLRRLNGHLTDIRPRHYRLAVRPLTSRVLATLRDEETRPRLDATAAAYAAELNRSARAAISAGGYRVAGSLEEDLPVPATLEGYSAAPEAPPEGDVLRAAAAAWADYAARTGTTESSRPRNLDEVVVDCARLMRTAHGWAGDPPGPLG
jgi:hypothetical protein